MSDDQGTPKIQIDSDWKAEAQAEKAKLAEKAKHTVDRAAVSSCPLGSSYSKISRSNPPTRPTLKCHWRVPRSASSFSTRLANQPYTNP